MNLQNTAIKLFSGKVLGAFLTFLAITFFTRELPPSALGAYFLFETTLGLLSFLADFGLDTSTEKRISEGDSPKEVFSSAIVIKFGSVTLFSILIVMFRGLIDNYIGAEFSLLLIPALYLQQVANLTVGVIKGELRVEDTVMMQISRRTVWASVGAGFVVFDYGAYGLIYALVISYAVLFLWGSISRNTAIGLPSLTHVRDLISYSKYVFVSRLSAYLYDWADLAIIGFFLTNSDVAAYEIAWRIGSLVTLLSTSIGTTLFPQISEWSKQGAYHRIESILPDALTLPLLLVIPAFFGTSLFAESILTELFGPTYAIARLALIILIAQRIVQSLYAILERTLKAIDHPELSARATIIAISTNLVLTFLLVPSAGLAGAAIATLLSSSLGVVLYARYLIQFVQITLHYRYLGWSFVSAIAMTLVLLPVRHVLEANTLARLLLVIGVGASVYSGVILMYMPLRTRIMTEIKTLFDHLFSVSGSNS